MLFFYIMVTCFTIWFSGKTVINGKCGKIMLDKLINEDRIEIHFQPIVSMKENRIFAFEALTRAYDENNDFISPLFLFEHARKENRSVELDDYVRKLALYKFVEYYSKDNTLLLFLNFEASMIDEDVGSSFLQNIDNCKIPYQNIIIEIKEDSVRDNYFLEKFVLKYRKLGFLIGVDDFGTGYSSFDRLALIKPDIVKLDRSLIYNIQNNYINSEILTSISNMCHKIGAVVLAEGVEQNDEILTCMTKDIDIYQGFFFSKAQDIIDTKIIQLVENKINEIQKGYKLLLQDYYEKEKKLLKRSKKIIKKTLDILNSDTKDYRKQITKIIQNDSHIEAIYLLDLETGLQIGDTIIEEINQRLLYSPTNDGHDHSFKEYYLYTKDSKNKEYLTDKYISKATGNMCNTYCLKIKLQEVDYILCCDIVDEKNMM